MNGIYAVKNYPKSCTSEFDTKVGSSAWKSTYDMMVYELPIFDSSIIDRVYVGKPHSCMCGCSGTYHESKDNFSKCKRVINKMSKNAGHGIEVIKDYIYTIIIGNTQYSLYLKETNNGKAS
jgi:hypothetical protein